MKTEGNVAVLFCRALGAATENTVCSVPRQPFPLIQLSSSVIYFLICRSRKEKDFYLIFLVPDWVLLCLTVYFKSARVLYEFRLFWYKLKYFIHFRKGETPCPWETRFKHPHKNNVKTFLRSGLRSDAVLICVCYCRRFLNASFPKPSIFHTLPQTNILMHQSQIANLLLFCLLSSALPSDSAIAYVPRCTDLICRV